MNKTILVLLFLFAGGYGAVPGTPVQLDTTLNTTDFCGKIGIVSCPKPADVKSMMGNKCRTTRNVMKEIMEEIVKCKYLLDSKKEISAFKGNANISFQITSDGYLANYKVVKTDIKRKSILKDIENQIRSTQFGKAEGRDCVSEITCNFKLKVLTMKKNCPQ
jgi:hypothetical protein